MIPAGYQKLIESFLEGKITSVGHESFEPQLRPVHRALVSFRKRKWEEFERELAEIPREIYERLQADLEFLNGVSNIVRARYAEASSCLAVSQSKTAPEGALSSPELILFNHQVIRSLQAGYQFQRELPLLRKLRKNPAVEPLVLSSYGYHYLSRGNFKRALGLYQKAFEIYCKKLRINDFVLAGAMAVNSALHSGELAVAERILKKMNQTLKGVGDAYLKERYDIAYAQYLLATERFDESLTHIEFSLNRNVPVEYATMLMLQAENLVALGRSSSDALPLLKQVEQFAIEKRLSEDTFLELQTTLAAAHMDAGDYAEAYRCLIQAESLAYAHHNACLRAGVMIQKARLNRRQGKPAPAARILLEVIQVCARQRYFIPLCHAIRSMAHEELIGTLDLSERETLVSILQTDLPIRDVNRAKKAAAEIERMISGTTPAKTKSAKSPGQKIAVAGTDDDTGIYFEKDGSRTLLTKTHRLPGKLLVQFLRSPNRDISFDHLHLELWGCPIRNESHIQKLKTLVSRLRTDLKEKGVPVEIESREYSTYRAVIPLQIQM